MKQFKENPQISEKAYLDKMEKKVSQVAEEIERKEREEQMSQEKMALQYLNSLKSLVNIRKDAKKIARESMSVLESLHKKTPIVSAILLQYNKRMQRLRTASKNLRIDMQILQQDIEKCKKGGK